jgi:hypothetical protein
MLVTLPLIGTLTSYAVAISGSWISQSRWPSVILTT